MMLDQLPSASNWFSTPLMRELYDQTKIWVFIGSVCFGGFKLLQWFKTLKSQDLKEIRTGLVSLHTEMKEGFASLRNETQSQTTSVVNELKELRADFRAYNTPPVKVYARARGSIKNKNK